MPEVYCFTPTRADTPERAKLLINTITQARETAGMEFYWLLWCNGGTLGRNMGEAAFTTKLLDELYYTPNNENVGQHPPFNYALQQAREDGYTYLLRLDDDVEFKSKRWLARLVDISKKFDDKLILSPKVRGLSNPTPCHPPIFYKQVQIEVPKGAIGGICRLHPVALLDEYVSDVRLPLGSGDATGIITYCQRKSIVAAYVLSLNVRHAKSTVEQEVEDKQHFSTHAIYQHIPYIPLCE